MKKILAILTLRIKTLEIHIKCLQKLIEMDKKSLQEQIEMQAIQIKLLNERDDLVLEIIEGNENKTNNKKSFNKE